MADGATFESASLAIGTQHATASGRAEGMREEPERDAGWSHRMADSNEALIEQQDLPVNDDAPESERPLPSDVDTALTRRPIQSTFYIVIQRTDDLDNSKVSLNLTDVCVFGIPNWKNGKSFPLVKASPGRWEIKESIELTADVASIGCIVRSGEGEDIGYLHLDVINMRITQMPPTHQLSRVVDTYDAQIGLTMLWHAVEVPSESDVEQDHAETDEEGGRGQLDGEDDGGQLGGQEEDAARQLGNYGVERLRASMQTGKLSDLTEAVSMLQQAVDIAPHNHPWMPRLLSNLVISLNCRFERTGVLSDITESISAQQRAVDLTPEGHVDLPGFLYNLGNSFMCRFERTGALSDITEAISSQQRAVDLTPQGHADLPGCLNNLGISFKCRFERTGVLSDITEAISWQQRAVDLTPQSHAHLPIYLTRLGNSFAHRFKRTGVLSDITEAISVQQRAVDLTPQGHADLPGRLNNLGNSFARRFERTGILSDITEAISLLQGAVDLTPQDHADLPGHLNNLGNSFTRRFERTGVLSDITEAISAQQRAVDLTPRGHAEPLHLINLGTSFARRFERTGVLSDITEAISAQQNAVDLTPQGHADLPGFLSNLGTSFNSRFKQTGVVSDITEAISAQQRAVDLTPQGHAHLPLVLSNLGNSFTRRFERTGVLSDITEAISAQQRAVDVTPQGHADLPGCLNNLGISFKCRFERTGVLSDITEAISAQQRAVDLTPQGHTNMPGQLLNLGQSFYLRSSLNLNKEDLEAALSHYKAAATSPVGRPGAKLAAARNWARTLIQHNPQSPDIVLAFDTALGLVALIAGLEQTVQGRYTQLEDSSGLALEAAAAACVLNRADKALEWLEQGRCLVWSQLNNLRTPLDDLYTHDEELARSIADTAKRLETAGSSRGQSDMTRAIRGFESFLMPASCCAIMRNIPESGPIVIITLDKHRCDALALLAGLEEPIHIPLPNFTLEKASAYRIDLDSELRSQHLRSRAVEDMAGLMRESRGIRPARMMKRLLDDPPVHRVLRGLWQEVVKPILDALGFSCEDRASGRLLPRLWWCPTGPLTFLPLHAAGIYLGQDSESAFDYVVSSYTPTVAAITDRVQRNIAIDAKGLGLFLTSQPSVPGAPSIPGTTREVQSIFRMAEERGTKVLKLEGDEVTVGGCIEGMESFSSIHLACHGTQNAADPLKSRFLFHQGSLELGTILKSNLRNADLAFLSACQTSTGEEKLSDEAVHLAAGMLAAGYRRVVGTMWSIRDQAAQEVSIAFYKYIFDHQGGTIAAGFDGSHSAHALHHATQQLRDSPDDSELSLLTWIPFVHFGY
ncbi:CHAT domain-containing protein [Ephemerocybe angulata]|uniref:CHAT domain-containing protein n=1 Tax=Ephemerocybe angulata TaxID=980116 RepID=A0A8H6HDZ4_9AGAR|nr:CHAT domain-containing protein [Tulosesus angulatus]